MFYRQRQTHPKISDTNAQTLLNLSTQDHMGRKEGNEGIRRAPKGHFVVYVGDELSRHIVPFIILEESNISATHAESSR